MKKTKNTIKGFTEAPLWKKIILTPLAIMIGFGIACTFLALLYAIIAYIYEVIFADHHETFASLFIAGFLPFNGIAMQYWMWVFQLILGLFLSLLIVGMFFADKETPPFNSKAKAQKDPTDLTVLSQHQINVNFNVQAHPEEAEKLKSFIKATQRDSSQGTLAQITLNQTVDRFNVDKDQQPEDRP